MERRDGVVSSRIPLFVVRLCSLVPTSLFHDAGRMRRCQDAVWLFEAGQMIVENKGEERSSWTVQHV